MRVRRTTVGRNDLCTTVESNERLREEMTNDENEKRLKATRVIEEMEIEERGTKFAMSTCEVRGLTKFQVFWLAIWYHSACLAALYRCRTVTLKLLTNMPCLTHQTRQHSKDKYVSGKSLFHWCCLPRYLLPLPQMLVFNLIVLALYFPNRLFKDLNKTVHSQRSVKTKALHTHTLCATGPP